MCCVRNTIQARASLERSPSILTMRMQLAIFASHEGTNLQTVIDACKADLLQADVAVVISNNSGARALLRASEHGIAYHHLSSTTHPNPDELDKAILQTLDLHAVDYIVTAGYMKKLKTRVLATYAHRIFNTHPSLLPKHGGRGMYGLRVHEAVLAAGDKVTGITIHEVNEHYDEGDIIAQTRVPVMPNDTPMTLAARVQALERRFLIETLATILETRH